MSDSVRPHRRQPTRLPWPWDSPGKNTGVGCHFLLQCMKGKSESEVAQSCPIPATPWTAAHQAPPSMGFSRQEYWSGVPSPSPKNTGVGCYFLLQIRIVTSLVFADCIELLPEKAMAAHSSTLAWQIPWAEEPGGLQSIGSLESGTTERLHFHFPLSCIGEGNGNPPQCSCLENPRDGGAWWAAVYGVAQSRTRLKQLSSSIQC